MHDGKRFSLLDSVEIAMRDGCGLRADIWLPEGQGPWPVLLQRTPYRKDDAFGTQYISAVEFKQALRRGYAIVVQDTRGRYESEGAFSPFAWEAQDGCDTVSWLRQQSFCNGQVVMFGASYVGATQVLAAAAGPDGLVAVSPHLTTGRHGETWTYRGGAIELAFLLLWIIESLGPEDLRRRLSAMQSADADRARQLLADLQADPPGAFARLPIIDEDLVALAPYAQEWLDSSRAASAAADEEKLTDLAHTKLPFLVSCGWNDLFVEGSIELFEVVRSRWKSANEVPDRLIIGPWSHGNPSDWQGDFWLGCDASTSRLPAEQLDFFDDARAGRLPSSPMVRYFRSGSNTWHEASDWPLPGASTQTLFLSSDRLTWDDPEHPWARSYRSDTLNPVPTVGGANFVPGLLLGKNSGPKDQRTVERRDDVLLFTSDPLTEDFEVTGLVQATLWVSSTGRSADWTARLCEVTPDGRSVGLVDGIFRQVNTSGEPSEVFVRVGHVSHLFRRGNRLRLQIASSNFPRFDRNPQSGVPPERAAASDFQVATHTIHGGPGLVSRLTLPVLGLRL